MPTGTSVVIPSTSGYPVSFLAEVATSEYSDDCCVATGTGDPAVELLVFTRQRAHAPWKISLVSAYLGGAESFLSASTPTQPAGDANVPDELAAYWQTWVDTGKEPVPGTTDSTFTPGHWTTRLGARFAAEVRPGGALCTGCKAGMEFRADAEHDGQWSFSVGVPPGVFPEYFANSQFQLNCSTVRGNTVITAARGKAMTQDAARANLGGWLKPGPYRSVTLDDIHQVCVLSNGNGLSAVVSDYADIVRVTGERTSTGESAQAS